jgi:hypothetical protein
MHLGRCHDKTSPPSIIEIDIPRFRYFQKMAPAHTMVHRIEISSIMSIS